MEGETFISLHLRQLPLSDHQRGWGMTSLPRQTDRHQRFTVEGATYNRGDGNHIGKNIPTLSLAQWAPSNKGLGCK